MTKWEYQVIRGPIGNFLGKNMTPEAELNKFGSEGWELVNVTLGAKEVLFFFKREAKS